MSKRSYIVAKTIEDLYKFKKEVSDGLSGGFVIMSTDTYQDLIPEGRENALVCTMYNDRGLNLFRIPNDAIR